MGHPHRPAGQSRVAVVLKGLGALVVLVAIGVGVPAALIALVGSPAPSSGFHPSQAMDEFRRTGIADTTVMKLLSVVVWLAWARLVAGALVEVVGRLRRRPVRRVRVLGSSQKLAGHLVGSIVLMLSSLGARSVGAAPLQPTVGGLGAIPQLLVEAESATPSGVVGADWRVTHAPARSDWSTDGTATQLEPRSELWTVKRNDSFWGIAESTLGDGMRWREIVMVNVGREVAPGVVFEATTEAIHPGWVLAVPSVGSSTEATTAPGERTVRVAPGDSLGRIAEAEYGDSAEWRSLWDANRDRVFGSETFDDPNLIRVGWELVVPDDAAVLDQPEADIPVSPVEDAPRDPAVSAAGLPTPANAPTAGRTADRMPEPGRPADTSVRTSPTDVADKDVSSISGAARGIDPLADADARSCRPAVMPSSQPASSSSLDDAAQVGSGRSVGQIALMPAGLGGSLLAGGMIALVASKRRRQLQRAARGAIAGPLPDELVGASRALSECAAPERLARLDAALRAAASQLADLPNRSAVVAALVDPMGTIEFAVNPPSASLPAAPFTGDAARWLLAPDVATSAIAPVERRFAAFPHPGIVQIGRSADCDVYVDVETVGMLSIDGEQSSAILRALVTALAVSPFAELARLVRLLGDDGSPELDHRTHVGRGESVDTLDAALDLAADAVAPILGQLGASDTSAALRIRSSGEPWEPLVLVADSSTVQADAYSALLELTSTGGRGLGIVTNAPIHSPWCLVETPAGWVLDPLGWAIEPVGLTPTAARTLRSLVDHASVPLTVGPSPTKELAVADSIGLLPDVEREEAGDQHALAFPAPPREPLAWSLMLRVLGSVDVVDADGRCAEFEKSKSLELLTWLTEHRRTATRTGARGALWNNEVRDATFANVVSDARRSLARLLPGGPVDGGEWVGRTLTEQLTIHPMVVSDLDVVRDALARAKEADDRTAVAILRPAVELIRGVPFAGVAYLWADSEALGSNAALLAITVAGELAERALRAGDADTALWATSQGLIALPGHEDLVGLRLRAHACRHDVVGLRQEWDQYERILDADPWLDSEPSPSLVDLKATLLASLKSR